MGTREFTDESERLRRRDLVAAVGERVYGGSWQTPLADALSAVSGRPLGRARVAQWMLAEGAKPVPAWVLDALPAIARDGAARLRQHADELDAIVADQGTPPTPQGEPESEELDVDAFVERVCSEPPRRRPQPAPEPEPVREGWRSDVADDAARGIRPKV